jgi:hypothetical protein
MASEWSRLETDTHQDHVIAHVVGATVLGYFLMDETAYLLLDIGFIWRIYVDGQMGLLPQGVAIAELEIDDEAKAVLRAEVDQLQGVSGAHIRLSLLRPAPAESLIREVSLQAQGERRRIFIEGEGASLCVETSLKTGEINISEAESNTV